MRRILAVAILLVFLCGCSSKAEKTAASTEGTESSWECICGQKGNTGNFCTECGLANPDSEEWDCSCGQKGNTGNFCPECGLPKPNSQTWDCSCGQKENTGKFCGQCGSARPSDTQEPEVQNTQPAVQETKPTEPAPVTKKQIWQPKVGDTVKFGRYEQDNVLSNGPEEIEWQVLDVKNGRALIISKYCLDKASFHGKRTSVTWETSDLRQWLNHEFMSEAFSLVEQLQMTGTVISTPDSEYGNKSGGNDTSDVIFCLSSDEARRYFSSDAERKAVATEYAAQRAPFAWWWLRSPGGASDAAKAVVTADGKVTTGGNWVNNNDMVRPAMWIDLKLLGNQSDY